MLYYNINLIFEVESTRVGSEGQIFTFIFSNKRLPEICLSRNIWDLTTLFRGLGFNVIKTDISLRYQSPDAGLANRWFLSSGQAATVQLNITRAYNVALNSMNQKFFKNKR